MRLRQLVAVILGRYRAGRRCRGTIRRGLVASLLLLVAHDCARGGARVHPVAIKLRRVVPTVRCVKVRCVGPVSKRSLTSVYSLDRTRLHHGFGRCLGVSPIRCLAVMQVRGTCRLLGSAGCPVARITLQIKCRSISSFGHGFRGVVNISPCRCGGGGDSCHNQMLSGGVSTGGK